MTNADWERRVDTSDEWIRQRTGVERRRVAANKLNWRQQLLVGDRSGQLIALDPASGEALWTHQLEGQLRGIGSFGDILFVGTIEGTIYALKAGGTAESSLAPLSPEQAASRTRF